MLAPAMFYKGFGKLYTTKKTQQVITFRAAAVGTAAEIIEQQSKTDAGDSRAPANTKSDNGVPTSTSKDAPRNQEVTGRSSGTFVLGFVVGVGTTAILGLLLLRRR